MLTGLLIACVLVAGTVVMHCACLAMLMIAVKRRLPLARTGFWPITRLLVGMSWCLILAHLAEIVLWGAFYLWWGGLPDSEAAFYFSGVTFTTIGYGDLVLAKPWRVLAPAEGLAGILMCGLSASFFFAAVSNIYRSLQANTTADPTTGTPHT